MRCTVPQPCHKLATRPAWTLAVTKLYTVRNVACAIHRQKLAAAHSQQGGCCGGVQTFGASAFG